MSLPTSQAEPALFRGEAKQRRQQDFPTVGLTRPDVPRLLRTLLNWNDEFGIEVGSLAKTPYRPNEKIATVTIPQASQALPRPTKSEAQGSEWELRGTLDNAQLTLYLDTHFFGLTPLHDADDEKCTIDLVAISGLNGHAFGSFKQRGGSFMWLRDALPKDLRDTRIFIYGYDTHLENSESIQSLTDLGLSFKMILRGLNPNQRLDAIRRPLVFIGHSLGGLVIKEAFISMREPPEKQILDKTRGLLFFGVPNFGMDIKSLIPMVGDEPNRALLETLGKNSALLRQRAEEFQKVSKNRKLQLISFFETRQSSTAIKVEGKWKMEGPQELLVDFASATNGHSHYHPINRNHSEMVKFDSPDDKSYLETLEYLRQLMTDTSLQQQTAITPMLSSDDSACLESLAFIDQDWQRDGVKSVEDTCNWIFSHNTFKAWCSAPQELLWIRGKPGSGKSTMMKHIDQHLEKQNPGGRILASFFFNGRSDSFLTTLLAAYRALLRQILAHFPEYLSQLTNIRKAGLVNKGHSWTWTTDDLQRFFSRVIPEISRKRHVSILVDALDESGSQNAREFVDVFAKVINAAREAGGVLKICFSCRHYPIITYDTGLAVNMEDQNDDDITKTVKAGLGKVEEEGGPIERHIITNARGIFQWANLVLNLTVKLKLRRKSSQCILEKLKQVPNDLKELYSHLLLASDPDEDPDDRRQTLKLFQWMCFSARPLDSVDIQHALAIDAQMAFTSIKEYMRGEHFYENLDDMNEVVKTLSKGLAEFRLQRKGYKRRKHVLQPIHQTVLDYLLENGLKELYQPLSGDPTAYGHYQLFLSCVKYLKLQEIMALVPKKLTYSNYHTAYDSPLLEYSLASFLYHLCVAGKSEVDCKQIIDMFNWPSELLIIEKWAALSDTMKEYEWLDYRACRSKVLGVNYRLEIFWPKRGLSLVHLAALIGNSELLNVMIKRKGDIILHAKNEQLFTPLALALLVGEEGFANDLIATSIAQHQTSSIASSPYLVFYAAKGVYHEILSWLLACGADPNRAGPRVPGYFRETALCNAVSHEHKEVCKILLDWRANPEIEDGLGMKPLAYAIQRKNEEICKLLVSHNAKVLPALSGLFKISHLGSELSCKTLEIIKTLMDATGVRLIDAFEEGYMDVFVDLYKVFGPEENVDYKFVKRALFVAVQKDDISFMFRLLHDRDLEFLFEKDWLQLPNDKKARKKYRATIRKFCSDRRFDLEVAEVWDSFGKKWLGQRRLEILKSLEDSKKFWLGCDRAQEGESSMSSTEAGTELSRSRKRKRTESDGGDDTDDSDGDQEL